MIVISSRLNAHNWCLIQNVRHLNMLMQMLFNVHEAVLQGSGVFKSALCLFRERVAMYGRCAHLWRHLREEAGLWFTHLLNALPQRSL